jgi:hypothetical protein
MISWRSFTTHYIVVSEHLSVACIKVFLQEVATMLDDIAPPRFYDSFSAKSFQKNL